MVENSLNKIINKKKQKLNELKKIISIESLKEKIKENSTFINFKEKIENNIVNNKISLIAEIKKASPSAGIIVQDYNPVDIAKKYYENKATCLSVLAEEDFFQGDLIHIHKIKQKINLPILCKDFFIDPFQVHLAKSYGADAILIILAGITGKMANQLYEDALKLNMSVIVEIHTKDEAKNSLKFEDALIGINNRNLKTLEISINNTISIFETIKSHQGPIVSESGIKNEDDVKYIYDKTGIKNFLIGESLLNSGNPAGLIKKIIQINQ